MVQQIGNYQVESKVLGEGGFGKVFTGKHVRTGERVAIKRCTIQSEEDSVVAMQEIKHFQAITPHKHVVRMLEHKITRRYVWVVMEFCDLGNLQDYMMKHRICPFDRQVALMHQCASAVHHLHTMARPIIHRDIKPENVLCKMDNGSVIAKLTDFGISKITESYRKNFTMAGTPMFMAPERLSMKPYDFSADTFELGLIFLAMITIKPTDRYMLPFSETARRLGKHTTLGEEMLRAKNGGQPLPVVISDSAGDSRQMKSVKTLIRGMTAYSPTQRTKMREVVSTLEEADGGSIERARAIPKPRAKRFVSNLRPRRPAPAPRAPMRRIERPAVESESESDEEGDAGYRLLRGLLEDHLRPERDEPVVPPAADFRGLAGAKDTFQLHGLAGGHRPPLDRPGSGLAAARDTFQLHGMGAPDPFRPQPQGMGMYGDGGGLAGARDTFELMPVMAMFRLAELEVGDRVILTADRQRARELQEGLGGWKPNMDKYLGEAGVVKNLLNGNQEVEVLFDDGTRLTLSAQAMRKAEADVRRPQKSQLAVETCPFKIMDLVRLNAEEHTLRKSQRGHGGYTHKMLKSIGAKGLVQRIFDEGDVYVEFFNGDKWSINPSVLELVDMSDEAIEAGDLVAVMDDKEIVQMMQEDCGGWNSEMAVCLGETGIVRSVGDDRAVVEVGEGRPWCWNKQVLRLLAKGEELVRIIMQKTAEEED